MLIFLTNCAAPGAALLGPAITGVTTKSTAQATLSFGTNQIVKKVHQASIKSKNKIHKLSKKIEDFADNSKLKKLINFHR